MRARGLKPESINVTDVLPLVAPHAGAWIETVHCCRQIAILRVAPHAGAWIETGPHRLIRRAVMGRAPCGRVD